MHLQFNIPSGLNRVYPVKFVYDSGAHFSGAPSACPACPACPVGPEDRTGVRDIEKYVSSAISASSVRDYVKNEGVTPLNAEHI